MCSLILFPPKEIMKTVLVKTCFHRGFEVFKNVSFVKEKGGPSKIKSGTKNLQNLTCFKTCKNMAVEETSGYQ